MPLGSIGQNVSNLACDLSLDLAAIAKRAESLTTSKSNALKLLAGIFDTRE